MALYSSALPIGWRVPPANKYKLLSYIPRDKSSRCSCFYLTSRWWGFLLEVSQDTTIIIYTVRKIIMVGSCPTNSSCRDFTFQDKRKISGRYIARYLPSLYSPLTVEQLAGRKPCWSVEMAGSETREMSNIQSVEMVKQTYMSNHSGLVFWFTLYSLFNSVINF